MEGMVRCPNCKRLIRICYDFGVQDVYCVDCKSLFKVTSSDLLLSGIQSPLQEHDELIIEKETKLTLELDIFETINIIYGGHEVKLSKSKIMQFLDLFRE